ncbi:MAG: hypothetical protein AB1553_05450 [Nitrospirota bacterium]
MILHPGILALITGTAVVFVMLLYASAAGIRVLARWDFESSSEEQLSLERQTYLIASIIKYALGFELLSGLLFLYTVDDLHKVFVGAMCATGSLNANPIGWYALYAKIIIFFAASLWIMLNSLDQKAINFPLVKPKYVALLMLTVLVGLDLFFQLGYFLGLEPEVITSCCGSLFSDNDGSVAGELAGLPPGQTMLIFYGTLALFLTVALLCRKHETGILRYLLTLLSGAALFVSLAAMVSFISLYFYELPSHHCPFDVLQKNYHFIGYPLYISLFGGVLFGLLPGIAQPLKQIESLKEVIRKSEQQWVTLSIIFMLCFLAIASWPILFGNLSLLRTT